MKVIAYDDLYKSGFLDYALSCLEEQGSFTKYVEWLKTEPVAMFTNEDNYTKEGDFITYSDDDEDSQDIRSHITMKIELNGKLIYHSLGQGGSFFFKKLDGNRLLALYVD